MTLSPSAGDRSVSAQIVWTAVVLAACMAATAILSAWWAVGRIDERALSEQSQTIASALFDARSRLTADGIWYRCLYAQRGTDLRGPLRAGATTRELRDLIVPAWRARADRGAEERLRLRDRSPLIQIARLRQDPHLEMHTRGG